MYSEDVFYRDTHHRATFSEEDMSQKKYSNICRNVNGKKISDVLVVERNDPVMMTSGLITY